jgi:hypothetical protein
MSKFTIPHDRPLVLLAMPVMITLGKIIKTSLHNNICYEALEAHEHLDMDTQFPLSNFLEFNDLDGTLCCFKALPEHIEIPKRFALWCARDVQHLITDEICINVLDVAERYLDGNATGEELKAASTYAVLAAGAAITAACGDVAATVRASCVASTYAVCAGAAAAYAVHDDDDDDDDADAARAARIATYAATRKRQINKLREMLD